VGGRATLEIPDRLQNIHAQRVRTAAFRPLEGVGCAVQSESSPENSAFTIPRETASNSAPGANAHV